MPTRIVAQNEFFTSYVLPPSRVQWAARNAREAAEAGSADDAIVACLDALYEMTRDYTARRRAWRALRDGKADPAVARADHAVDRRFSNFVARVEMTLEDFGPDSPEGRAAEAMLAGPLDVEVFSVTNAAREDEEAMLRSILGDLEADHLDDVDACGLTAVYERLAQAFDEFVAVMTVAGEPATPPTTDELRARREAIESKMIEAIHRVNGAYPTTSEDDRRMRSLILGPFAIQNDRLAAFYRANGGGGKAPGVDPQTGEELAEDAVESPEPTTDAEPLPEPS